MTSRKHRTILSLALAGLMSLTMVAGPVSFADTNDEDSEPESYARLYTEIDQSRTAITQQSSAPRNTIQAACGSGGPCLFYLNNSWQSGNADLQFNYGSASDKPLAGDWNGDGKDTIGIRRGNEYFLRNTNSGGGHDHWVKYGRASDQSYIGDWDGNGTDTIGIRRGNEYHLRNINSNGPAHKIIRYGKANDETFVGDWNGDGRTTIAVRRGNTFYLKNSLSGGSADIKFNYGRRGDEVHVGDWNGDGKDTFAVRRGNEWFIRNDFKSGNAQTTIRYGKASDTPIVGDWDGNGTTTPGVHRAGSSSPSLPSQTPVMVYGTLRTGQPAHNVVQGRFTLNVLGRAPSLELWVTDHPYPSYPVWPWALPGSTGMTGEMLFFPNATYNAEVARLDNWEGYTPGGNPNTMNYIREKRATNQNKSAWVYVATPWRQTYAKNYGTKVVSGDITRF